MWDITDLALRFIADYGLVAIFVLLVLDGALLLPVFPGEIVLIMAVGAYASDPAGLVLLIALASAAALLGTLLLYAMTRGGGRRLVERYPRFFMMPRKLRERLERAFQRPAGQSLVLWLRLVPLTRILVAIPAGLARMRLPRFVALSALGLTAYHAGFLWLAYESKRPDSPVATQRQQLVDAYASPAWDFVQTNAVIAGAALLLVGVVVAMRSWTRMYHDPAEANGSLIGTLSVVVLIWGGVALAVAAYMEPDLVYGLAQLGGVDVHAAARRLGLGPLQFVWGVSASALLFGIILAQMRNSAVRRRRAHRRSEKAMRKAQATEERGVPGTAGLVGAGGFTWEEHAAPEVVQQGNPDRAPAERHEESADRRP